MWSGRKLINIYYVCNFFYGRVFTNFSHLMKLFILSDPTSVWSSVIITTYHHVKMYWSQPFLKSFAFSKSFSYIIFLYFCSINLCINFPVSLLKKVVQQHVSGCQRSGKPEYVRILGFYLWTNWKPGLFFLPPHSYALFCVFSHKIPKKLIQSLWL